MQDFGTRMGNIWSFCCRHEETVESGWCIRGYFIVDMMNCQVRIGYMWSFCCKHDELASQDGVYVSFCCKHDELLSQDGVYVSFL